jgi:membrane protease YdiL (CAAX protease family)
VISDKRWDSLSVIVLALLIMVSLILAMVLSYSTSQLLAGRVGPQEMMLISMAISLICVQGLALVWVHVFLRWNELSWGEAFGLSQHNYRQCVVLALLALVLAFIGMAIFGTLSSTALELAADRTGWQWLKPEPQPIVQLLQNNWPWWLLAMQGFTAIVVAPVGEELLFRGILYGFIKQRGYPRLGLWISSVVFALVHGNAVGFLALVFLAMILVAIYEQTKNIFAPILLHSLFNTVNFALIVTQPKWSEKLFNS